MAAVWVLQTQLVLPEVLSQSPEEPPASERQPRAWVLQAKMAAQEHSHVEEGVATGEAAYRTPIEQG